MSTNKLDLVGSGDDVQPKDPNQYHTALRVDVVPRNLTGAPENEAGSLGQTGLQWLNGRFKNIFLDGQPLTPTGQVSARNQIESGQIRSTSTKSDFIRADGTSNDATIEAGTTPLVLDINGTTVTISSDINLTSLQTAPTTNNTCDVDDTNLTGTNGSKYQGEDETSITVDNMGSEISSRVGQYVALQNGTSEVMLAYVKSTTELTNIFRGFFFDDSGDPIVRETLSNNDTLTLYELGWVFVQDDGTTTEVSYLTPIWSYDTPSSTTTGQYWYDMNLEVWKRYSGSSYDVIDRTLLGWVVIDETNCIGSRSLDFALGYNALNTIEDSEIESVTQVKTSSNKHNIISINGTQIDFGYYQIIWDITTDLESGFTEAASTWYYLYLDEKGQRFISPERPYFRPDLQGYYHPYNTWRWIAESFNDSGSDLTETFVEKKGREYFTITGIGIWNRPILFNKINVDCLGAGGGVSSGGGTAGGSSSFFTMSGLGGSGGNSNTGASTNGGVSGTFDLSMIIESGPPITPNGNKWKNISSVRNYGQGGNSTSPTTNIGLGGCGGRVIRKYSKSNINFDASYVIGSGGVGGTGGTAGTNGIIILEYL